MAENLSEGQVIDPIYHPEDFFSQSAQDENKSLDYKNPVFYSSSDPPTSPESPRSVESRIATIKFDKFAQLLLYDGSRRSKYNKIKNQFPPYHNATISMGTSKRQDLYKNRASLSLSPTLSPNTISKLKTLRLHKLSKFATIHPTSNIDEIVELADEHLVPVRPILKSKHNQNADVESVRARYCDEVEVEDFIDFFENHEKQRMESEPYLEKVRERQVSTYYSSEETSASTTENTNFSD